MHKERNVAPPGTTLAPSCKYTGDNLHHVEHGVC